MGTLKVNNIQKRDGTALITDGAASTTLLSQAALRSAGVREIKIATASASNSSEVAFDNTVFTSDYKSYVIRINDFVLSTNADFTFADSPDNGSTFSFTSSLGHIYSLLGSNAEGGSGGTNSNAHTFAGFNHDATGTVNTNFLELHLPYFTQTQINKLYYAKYMNGNNNGSYYGAEFSFNSSLSSAMNYIKFMGASGNITKGAFTVYGVVE